MAVRTSRESYALRGVRLAESCAAISFPIWASLLLMVGASLHARTGASAPSPALAPSSGPEPAAPQAPSIAPTPAPPPAPRPVPRPEPPPLAPPPRPPPPRPPPPPPEQAPAPGPATDAKEIEHLRSRLEQDAKEIEHLRSRLEQAGRRPSNSSGNEDAKEIEHLHGRLEQDAKDIEDSRGRLEQDAKEIEHLRGRLEQTGRRPSNSSSNEDAKEIEHLHGRLEQDTEEIAELRDHVGKAKRTAALAANASEVATKRAAEEERSAKAAERRAGAQAEEMRRELAAVHKELAAAKAQATALQEQVAEAAAARDEAQEQVKKLEVAAPPSSGLSGWLRSSGHQRFIALLAGALGLWGVGGPMAFIHVFKSVSGSLLAGFMVGGCWRYFRSSDVPTWLDAFEGVANGSGGFIENVLWLLCLIAGMVRWYYGWEWLLYAVVDDIYMTRPMAEVYLKQPLLAAERQRAAATALPEVVATGTESQAAVSHAFQPATAQNTPPESDGDAAASDEDLLLQDLIGLEHILDVVQQAREDSLTDARSTSTSHLHFWNDIAAEVAQFNVSEHIQALLVTYGFNRDQPQSVPVPPHQSLQELEANLRNVVNAMRADAPTSDQV